MVSSGPSTKSPQLAAFEDGHVPSKTNNALLFETMFAVEKSSEELREEQEVLSALYRELEEERNAAATAANEAISMISRLQNEKAVLQMEARHYQQRMEEKAFYNEKAITLLKEIILKQEADKLGLENEVKLYRQRLLTYSISKMKEESTIPNNNEVDGFFHELLAISDEEETLPTKSISESGEEVSNRDAPLKRDRDGQGELFGLQNTFHQTWQPLEACEPPILSRHHTSDEAGAESILSVLNVVAQSHCLGVEVKDVLVQNPVRSEAQDIIVDEFESTALKCANGKVDAWIGEADNVDEVVEEHWHVVLEQLWKLEEQIWNLRAIQLSDSKEHSCFFKDQQCKNSSVNDQYQSRKQQKESIGEGEYSRFTKHQKTRRLVKRRTGTMGEGLSEVKSRSKFHVECSPDVLEDEGSIYWHGDDFKVCTTKHDTKYQSMHPLNIKGEFDNRLLKSVTGKESPNFGAQMTADHHIPVADGKRVVFVSKEENVQTCEQSREIQVHKSGQCCYALLSQIADMCRITLKEKVMNRESRLQDLETARNAMTEAIETMKQNLGRKDEVHEITQKSDAREECSRLVEKVNCQSQGAEFAAELLKGFLLFTSLGDFLSKLARCLQFQVRLMEDMYPQTETNATNCEQDATPFSEKSNFQINKQASSSATDLTWLKDAQGRSGTAFAGWDL